MTDYTEPDPVTNIKAETEKDSAVLTWTGPANQDVTYKVELSGLSGAVVVTEAKKSYEGLPPATPYTFTVTPVCEGTRGDAETYKFFTSKYTDIYFLAMLFCDYLKQYQLS